MNFIHKTAQEELDGLYKKFFEKLPPQVQKYFNGNERLRVIGLELPLPPKELV